MRALVALSDDANVLESGERVLHPEEGIVNDETKEFGTTIDRRYAIAIAAAAIYGAKRLEIQADVLRGKLVLPKEAVAEKYNEAIGSSIFEAKLIVEHCEKSFSPHESGILATTRARVPGS